MANIQQVPAPVDASTPAVTAALIGLMGVLVGLAIRDVIMPAILAFTKRRDQLADRQADKSQIRHDLVRAYADPLLDAVKALFYRLDEIVTKKNGEFLWANAPKVPFHEYKRISTLYRIAALLGWLRAIKRERSSLDPQQVEVGEESVLLFDIEVALADGEHVERHRVEELTALWGVKAVDDERKGYVASKVDVVRAVYLLSEGVLSATDLSELAQQHLAAMCAEIIKEYGDRQVEPSTVIATAGDAAVILGIKEAYLYRDWQVAIGDMMLKEEQGGVRRYAVIGYAEFEDRYLRAMAENEPTLDARWFKRLEAIVHDLRMERADFADARRDQLKKLHESSRKLKLALEARIEALKKTVV